MHERCCDVLVLCTAHRHAWRDASGDHGAVCHSLWEICHQQWGKSGVCEWMIVLWRAGCQINVLPWSHRWGWSVLFCLVHSQYCSHTRSLAIWTVLLAYMISSSSLCLPLSYTLLFFQNAARMIKESMDKKFGNSWHVVIGEGFGFEVTHEIKNLLYMFFGGSLAVCVWKCSWCHLLATQLPLWDIYTRRPVLTMQPYIWCVCPAVWKGAWGVLRKKDPHSWAHLLSTDHSFSGFNSNFHDYNFIYNAWFINSYFFQRKKGFAELHSEFISFCVLNETKLHSKWPLQNDLRIGLSVWVL